MCCCAAWNGLGAAQQMPAPRRLGTSGDDGRTRSRTELGTRPRTEITTSRLPLVRGTPIVPTPQQTADGTNSLRGAPVPLPRRNRWPTGSTASRSRRPTHAGSSPRPQRTILPRKQGLRGDRPDIERWGPTVDGKRSTAAVRRSASGRNQPRRRGYTEALGGDGGHVRNIPQGPRREKGRDR